jgi:phosphatidylglycerol:prolipoprotein diacylglycerol transferase
MHPVLTALHLADRTIPIGSYGALLCLAIVIAFSGVLRAARAARLDPGATIAAFGAGIAGAFIGAALLHAAVQCVRQQSLAALLQPPGIDFFGAFFGAAAASLFAARLLDLPWLALADRAVPAFACAHAVGRIGCLLGGCCYGAPWHGPLAITYTDPLAPAAALAVPRHPLPLYESAGLLALALFFSLRRLHHPGSGRRFAAYAAGYSALRLALEPLRGDAVRGVFFDGALSTSQLIAAVVLACILLLRFARTQATPAAG